MLTEAELPESREILVIAHRQHVDLIEAIERGEGARAESIAREHARLALHQPGDRAASPRACSSGCRAHR